MCYAIIIPEKDGVFMKRNAMQSLINWKNDPERKPLILRGARQVGKTWLMKEFGQTCYANYVYFNFDEEDELKSIFQTNKNPHRIIELLSMISGDKIQPGETLILFDEIQECPEALNTLDIFPLTFDEFLEAIDPAIYPYYDGIQKRTTDRRDFSFAPVGGLQLLFYQRKIIFCSLTFFQTRLPEGWRHHQSSAVSCM